MAQQQLVKEKGNLAVKDEASLGDLFSDLAEQTGRLIRQEAALAKTEFADTAAAAGRSVGLVAAGGFIGYAGFLALMAALIVGLSYVMPLWLSAVIVGALLAVCSYFMVTSAIEALKKTQWAPEQTIESIKEDAQWLKNQVD